MTPKQPSLDAIPPELVEWMERYRRSGGAEPEDLVEAALRALDASLARPGRNREAAFALLAADGLMTSALEQLASSENPEMEMRTLIRSIASGPTGVRE